MVEVANLKRYIYEALPKHMQKQVTDWNVKNNYFGVKIEHKK